VLAFELHDNKHDVHVRPGQQPRHAGGSAQADDHDWLRRAEPAHRRHLLRCCYRDLVDVERRLYVRPGWQPPFDADSATSNYCYDQLDRQTSELRALAHFERDVWHIDALPGVSRKGHWPQRVISFVRVPECYRSAAKAYAKYLLAAQGRSIGTLIGNIRYMAQFLEYWLMRYPERTSLTDLRVQDLSDDVAHIRGPNATRTRFTIITMAFDVSSSGFSGLSIHSHQPAWPTVCLIRISPPGRHASRRLRKSGYQSQSSANSTPRSSTWTPCTFRS
jgi:hypothetical protein